MMTGNAFEAQRISELHKAVHHLESQIKEHFAGEQSSALWRELQIARQFLREGRFAAAEKSLRQLMAQLD